MMRHGLLQLFHPVHIVRDRLISDPWIKEVNSLNWIRSTVVSLLGSSVKLSIWWDHVVRLFVDRTKSRDLLHESSNLRKFGPKKASGVFRGQLSHAHATLPSPTTRTRVTPPSHLSACSRSPTPRFGEFLSLRENSPPTFPRNKNRVSLHTRRSAINFTTLASFSFLLLFSRSDTKYTEHKIFLESFSLC